MADPLSGQGFVPPCATGEMWRRRYTPISEAPSHTRGPKRKTLPWSQGGEIQEHGRCWSVIDADGGKHEDEEYAGAEEQRRTAQVAPFRAQIGILALVARA